MGKPKIRFKGYEDDWEQRKLEEYLGVSKEKNRDESFGKDDVLSVSGEYGIVNQIEFQGRSFAGASVANYGVVEGGDVVYTKSPLKSNPYGIIKTNKGKTGIVSTLYAVYKPKNNVGAEFVQIYFELDSRMNSYMHPLVNKGAKNDMKVSDENALKGSVIFPKIDEQKAISKYFAQLDHLITLHQRKCYRFIDIALDAWEQRKLGEMIKEYKETVDSDCILPVLTSSKTEGVILQEEHFGRKQQHDITGYNILPRNYCTYRNRSDGVDFTFNINKCCDKGIISKFYPVFSGNNSDVFFISLLLNNSDEIVQEIAYTCTGTGQKVLSFLDLQKMKIKVPNFEEQKKIAAYFDHLDHLITLHQRKCEETKSLKKYMLQKMFPENGKCVPKIRFSGFSDDWEQRKFGEIVEKYEDLVETPTEGYTRLGIRSHAKGTFHSFVEKGKELETAKMFRVAADKFIVNITFGWEHAVAITDENDAGKLVSHRFPQYSFNAGMVPKFFRYVILDENFKHHLELSSPGGAGRNRVLKLNDMLEYKMNFPSEVEQGKIAAYFDYLDHLITLHQHKCDELQKLKKFMLQNMFV